MNDQLIYQAFEQIADEAPVSRDAWLALEGKLRRHGRIRLAVNTTVSVAALLAVVVAVPRLQRSGDVKTFADTPAAGITPGSPTYSDPHAGFEVSYPSGWTLSYPKGSQYPILTSPAAEGLFVAMSPGATPRGCSVPASQATPEISSGTIAGAPATRCEQDGVPTGSARAVTYDIARPGSSEPNWVHFSIAAFTSAQWDQYGAEAEGIVRSLTWTQ
jgi:hypothetical protein